MLRKLKQSQRRKARNIYLQFLCIDYFNIYYVLHMLSTLLLVCALRTCMSSVQFQSLCLVRQLLITFREDYIESEFCLNLIALKLHEVSNQLSHFKACSNN